MAPINRYTLKEWLGHPTTIMLIISVNVIWVLIFIVTDMATDKSKECLEQVRYLRERVYKLEKQQDEYVRAIMLRDAKIRELTEGGMP